MERERERQRVKQRVAIRGSAARCFPGCKDHGSSSGAAGLGLHFSQEHSLASLCCSGEARNSFNICSLSLSDMLVFGSMFSFGCVRCQGGAQCSCRTGPLSFRSRAALRRAWLQRPRLARMASGHLGEGPSLCRTAQEVWRDRLAGWADAGRVRQEPPPPAACCAQVLDAAAAPEVGRSCGCWSGWEQDGTEQGDGQDAIHRAGRWREEGRWMESEVGKRGARRQSKSYDTDT